MQEQVKTVFSVLKQTVVDWLDDRAPRLGAALAYYAVFSIAPLIILVIAIAGLWFEKGQAQQQILGQVSALVGEQGAQGIGNMLEAANKPREGIIASVLAVVTLIFGATGVFVQLQDALNTIWEVKPKPGRGVWGFVRHRILSLAMVFAIGFLLLISLVLSAGLAAAGKWMSGSMPGGEALWEILNLVISFIVIAALFSLMFKYMPDVKIGWRDVWIGGALTALLFIVGKFALGMYLGRSSVASAYGAAGSLVILLLWVNIVDGTKMVTVKGGLGEMISTTVTDIRSALTTGRQVYGAFDVYSRPQSVTNLDGTWEFSQRFCCGDTITTNREGTITTKTYDVMNRSPTTQVNGITHSNTCDAAGNILKVERIGSGDSIIVLQRNGYDTAGHKIATTNALSEVTLFAEAHGLSGTTNITTRLTNSSSGPQHIEARYLDGRFKSRTGGLVHPQRHEYGPTSGATFEKVIKIDVNGGDTSEIITSFFDAAGRLYKIAYADGAFSQTFRNSKGQETNEIDPDGVSKITLYNPRGQPAFFVTDMDRDGVVDWSGTDRIEWTTNYVVNNGAADVHRSEERVWATNGTDAGTLVSMHESAVNGLVNWSASFGLTNRSESSFPGGGVRYSKSFAPDGTFTTTRFENGLAVWGTRTNSGTQLSATTFAYDAHNRQKFVTDARNGTTTNALDNLDRVLSRSTPVPVTGQSHQRTGYLFDAIGQVIAVTNSDNTLTWFTSQPTGEGTKTWGAREYAMEQTFDAQGRMKTMKTWQNFSGNSGTATTTWNYDSQRGWLASKRYANNLGPDYNYTPAGRLRQRTWARGTTTTYTTNAVGEVERLIYSDTTGNVTNTYDRRGRVTTVNSGTNITTRLYTESGLLLSETQNGIVVSNRYDELLRRTNVAVMVGRPCQLHSRVDQLLARQGNNQWRD